MPISKTNNISLPHSQAASRSRIPLSLGRASQSLSGAVPIIGLPQISPPKVFRSALLDVVRAVAVSGNGFALSAEGQAFAWGSNSNGRLLGQRDGGNYFTPIEIEYLRGKKIIQIAGGIAHTVALTAEGQVFAWGNNDYSQLGLEDSGHKGNHFTPTEIVALRGKKIIQIAVEGLNTVALTNEGEVFAWGDNGVGQLGLGDYLDRNQPTEVPGLQDVVQVSVGKFHSLAVTKDGRLFAWGDNGKGQLGLGDNLDRNQPTEVPGLQDVVQVSVGKGYSLAVTKDGRLFAWGDNGVGQLGLGDTLDRNQPTEVSGLWTVAQVSAGEFHSLAATSDGRLFAWGDNGNVKLGLGDNLDRNQPTLVLGLQDVVQVSAGEFHSFAVTKDGRLFAWGSNGNGRLGLGDQAPREKPTIVETKISAAAPDRSERGRELAGEILNFLRGHGKNGIKVEGSPFGNHLRRRPAVDGFDPAGYREYIRGEDDASQIDWVASAGKPKPLVKIWHPDQNRQVVVVVDPVLLKENSPLSEQGAKQKVAQVAGLIAGRGLVDKEKVSLVLGAQYLVKGGVGENQKHLSNMIAGVLDCPPAAEGQIDKALKEPSVQNIINAGKGGAGTRVVLIADFRQRSAELEGSIRALRAKGVTVDLVDLGSSTYTFPAPVVVMGGLEMEVDETAARTLCGIAANKREDERTDFLRRQKGRRVNLSAPGLAQVAGALGRPVSRENNVAVKMEGEERLEVVGREGGFDVLEEIINRPAHAVDLLPHYWKECYPGMFALFVKVTGKTRISAPTFAPPTYVEENEISLVFTKWLPELQGQGVPVLGSRLLWAFGPSKEEFLPFIVALKGQKAAKTTTLGQQIRLTMARIPSLANSFNMNNSGSVKEDLGMNRRLARSSQWLNERDAYLATGVATKFDPKKVAYNSAGITLADFEPRPGEATGPQVAFRFVRRARGIAEYLRPVGAVSIPGGKENWWQKLLGRLLGPRQIIALAGADSKAVSRLMEIPLVELPALLPQLFGEETAALLTAPTVNLPDLEKEAAEKWGGLLARVKGLKVKDAISTIHNFVTSNYKYFPYDGGMRRAYEAVADRIGHSGGESSNDQVRLVVSLGGGKCVELSVITLALLRAAGIPSALFQGYTAEGSSILDEGHQWAGVVLKDPLSGRLFHHPVETAVTPHWKRMWKEILVRSVNSVLRLAPDVAIATVQRVAAVAVVSIAVPAKAIASLFQKIFRWLTSHKASPAEAAALPLSSPSDPPPASGRAVLHEAQVMILGERETKRRTFEKAWNELSEADRRRIGLALEDARNVLTPDIADRIISLPGGAPLHVRNYTLQNTLGSGREDSAPKSFADIGRYLTDLEIAVNFRAHQPNVSPAAEAFLADYFASFDGTT